MPRKANVVLGPSRLSQILEILKKAPSPSLNAVRSLRITLALRNDHFGARHFVKEDLPRIRYANPAVDIQVNKVPKTREDQWHPEMVVEFQDGSKQTLNMNQKWSSAIFQELMDLAGGTPWQRWKTERLAAGLPVVDEALPKPRHLGPFQDMFYSPNRPKKGAAAVLP